MNDLWGIAFFASLAVGAYFGLRKLARPISRSEEDFERSAAASTSFLGASMNALQELLNPEEAKSRIVQTEIKNGRYNKKRREGKANGVNAPERTGSGD